jgi:hypothetical protein
VALFLKKDPTLQAEYVGNIGSKVRLTVKGEKGAAQFVVGAYDDAPLKAPSFTIVAGVKTLVVVISNDQVADWTAVFETDAQTDKMLRKAFKFDPKWPAVGYTIRGE